jgi:response regulator RpfG family c-di-GMP phosphodiesterase
VEEAMRNDYDLVLMDARMPVMNGIEAAIAIRSSDSSKSLVPILALSAAVTEEDKNKYKSAGMNGFIAKPFSEDELIREISKTIAKIKLKDEVKQSKEMKQETTIESTVKLDFAELRKISNQDVKFYKEMLETFISGTEEGMKQIDENLKTENWDTMAEYAHRISSPCRHLSALNLHSQLKEIEKRCRNQQDLTHIDELLKLSQIQSELVINEVKKELTLH